MVFCVMRQWSASLVYCSRFYLNSMYVRFSGWPFGCCICVHGGGVGSLNRDRPKWEKQIMGLGARGSVCCTVGVTHDRNIMSDNATWFHLVSIGSCSTSLTRLSARPICRLSPGGRAPSKLPARLRLGSSAGLLRRLGRNGSGRSAVDIPVFRMRSQSVPN